MKRLSKVPSALPRYFPLVTATAGHCPNGPITLSDGETKPRNCKSRQKTSKLKIHSGSSKRSAPYRRARRRAGSSPERILVKKLDTVNP